ncbi:hypothetical protein RDV89_04685 [Nocardioides zeae]|uniref:Secreted protein n=1 Tax=Nocardioides imazamoxiresistens TaxID=3231893 RepID=A0ABU3PT42_9ACTN|nr:hypothetical protein [Nocardioides zeae]MDT9592349.1 hypothetical protein [Nocardioides zeae]
MTRLLSARVLTVLAALLTAWVAVGPAGAEPAALAAAVLLLALAALVPAPQLSGSLRRCDPAARSSRGRTARRRGRVTDVPGHPRRPRAPGLA